MMDPRMRGSAMGERLPVWFCMSATTTAWPEAQSEPCKSGYKCICAITSVHELAPSAWRMASSVSRRTEEDVYQGHTRENQEVTDLRGCLCFFSLQDL